MTITRVYYDHSRNLALIGVRYPGRKLVGRIGWFPMAEVKLWMVVMEAVKV